MSDRYEAIVSIMDDPLNLICFLREFHRRKVGKFLLPPILVHGGGWILLPLKEAFKFYPSSLLAGNPNGDVYYQVWNNSYGAGWFVTNPRTEEELGPFQDEQTALKEALDLAVSEGLTVLDRWPWEFEDVLNYPA